MANFTKKVTVNGWTNLITALIAAGYTGTAALSTLNVLNNAATSVYLHLSNSATSNPNAATGSDPVNDGIPIGQGEALVEKSFAPAGGGEDFVDAGCVWLYSAAPVVVICSGVGGGI